MIEASKDVNKRLCQGDIISEVEHIEHVYEKDGTITISKIVFPYVLVLTQDCDLRQDYSFRYEDKKNQDKILISALVAPLYNALHVYSGEQLSDINIVSAPINEAKTQGQTLRQNKNPRYHYIEFPDDIEIVSSIIDFKHYFSVNINYLQNLKTSNFMCKISELYREDISQRFSSFLSRIGLPNTK